MGSFLKVSVVLCAYGSFDPKRLELSIESIFAQRGVDFEVVLVECNPLPSLRDFGSREGISYCFIGDTLLNEGRVNTGAIRNCGVAASSHPLLYLTDADIVMRQPDFLASVFELLGSSRGRALQRPPMRRLLIEFVQEFWRRYEDAGFASALDSLDYSQPHIATANGEHRPMKLVCPQAGGPHESWTTTPEQYEEYLDKPHLRRYVPLIFTGTRHWGGIALTREQFESVGGYASSFFGWGNEDTDIQWKLEEVFGLEFLPVESQFEVLHLDHTKPYFEPNLWERNRDVACGRRDFGVVTAIEADREAYRDVESGV